MKNDEPTEVIELVGTETPLMMFLEAVKLSFDDLYAVQQEQTQRVGAEIMNMLDLSFNMDVGVLMTVRNTEELTHRFFQSAQANYHLQELTTQSLFHLSCLGDRFNPYTYKEVVENFVLIFIPGNPKIRAKALLNADNVSSVSYYRDPEAMTELLMANPWLLVAWLLRLNKNVYSQYEQLQQPA